VDGRWCSTREWKWAPREYWRTKALTLGGTDVGIQSRDEVRIENAYDLDLQKLVQVRRVVPGVAFIGPLIPGADATARLRGTALIEVTAPGPIVECRILAAATIQDSRGSISVRAEGEGRPAVRLYAITSGTHRKAVDAGEALRGLRKFTLVAELETEQAPAADGRPQTFAYFLPGDAKDPEPLVIEGRIAEPQPQLDKLIPAK
jgi:hypothetical protein